MTTTTKLLLLKRLVMDLARLTILSGIKPKIDQESCFCGFFLLPLKGESD